MSLLNIDLTEVEADGPPSLAEGFYPALNIVKTSIGRDDSKGHLWLDVTLIDGANEDNRGLHSERFFINTQEPQKNWKLKRLLLATGNDHLAQGEFDPQELVGSGFPGFMGSRTSTKDGANVSYPSLKKIYLPTDNVPENAG